MIRDLPCDLTMKNVIVKRFFFRGDESVLRKERVVEQAFELTLQRYQPTYSMLKDCLVLLLVLALAHLTIAGLNKSIYQHRLKITTKFDFLTS